MKRVFGFPPEEIETNDKEKGSLLFISCQLEPVISQNSPFSISYFAK